MVAALLVLAAQLGATPYSAAARRDYRIRNVDPAAKDDPNSRRFWSVCDFTVWIEDTTADGKPAKALKREEKSTKGDRIYWDFIVAPDDRLLQVKHKVVSRQGKTLSESTEYLSNHFYKFPAKTMHGMMLPFAAEKMNLTLGKRQEMFVAFGTEMEPWQVFFTPELEEAVTVPAGTFKCVKIKVDYSTDRLPGFFRILPSFLIKQMMSGYSIWVMKDAPHFMVKFQGKLEGLGSPEKVQELIKIH